MPTLNVPHLVPGSLKTSAFTLRPIIAEDAARDFEAVMDSQEYLRGWEQTGWPAEDFTVEENRKDLEDLQERHQDGRALTFTVLTLDGVTCLGCVYVFPPGASFLAKSTVRAVSGEDWDAQDAIVYFWVRPQPMAQGVDEQLMDAVTAWLRGSWGYERIQFVTSELFIAQVALFARRAMTHDFDIFEPEKAAKYLAFRAPKECGA